jgi:hypothetical protein
MDVITTESHALFSVGGGGGGKTTGRQESGEPWGEGEGREKVKSHLLKSCPGSFSSLSQPCNRTNRVLINRGA